MGRNGARGGFWQVAKVKSYPIIFVTCGQPLGGRPFSFCKNGPPWFKKKKPPLKRLGGGALEPGHKAENPWGPGKKQNFRLGGLGAQKPPPKKFWQASKNECPRPPVFFWGPGKPWEQGGKQTKNFFFGKRFFKKNRKLPIFSNPRSLFIPPLQKNFVSKKRCKNGVFWPDPPGRGGPPPPSRFFFFLGI